MIFQLAGSSNPPDRKAVSSPSRYPARISSISGPSQAATSIGAPARSTIQTRPCRSSVGSSISPCSDRSTSPNVASRVIARSDPSML